MAHLAHLPTWNPPPSPPTGVDGVQTGSNWPSATKNADRATMTVSRQLENAEQDSYNHLLPDAQPYRGSSPASPQASSSTKSLCRLSSLESQALLQSNFFLSLALVQAVERREFDDKDGYWSN
eukprot:1803630-Rhodomonas_salina.1